MQLHCLGTAGYHPNAHRHTSCYFIPEQSLLLDAGTGLFRLGQRLQSDSLHVLLSHAHLDHVIGLTFFLEIMATTSLRNVHVYGERTKLEALRQHLFHPLIFPVLPQVHWRALEDCGTEFSLAGGRLRWFPLEHPGGSVGFRMDWPDYTLAYVTDTTATPEADYWNQVQGVDTLVHECNFQDQHQEFARKTGHSWTSAVLHQSARAQVRRLILTHVDPLLRGADPLDLTGSLAANGSLSPECVVVAEDEMVVPLTRHLVRDPTRKG